MKQLTLVSLYGQKTKAFANLIRGCIEIILSSPLRRVFKPYHLNQIHGTIIGLEKLVGFTEHYNANAWDGTGVKTRMDFGQFKDTLQGHMPMKIQIGGFTPGFTSFDSFGLWPHERSFQVQWATNRFTIIGWPHKDGDFTTARLLDNLRKDIHQKCQIKHKYESDNDLFIVFGEITALELLSDAELAQMKVAARSLEVDLRNFLAAKRNRIDIVIEAEHLCLAQYKTETLPLDSTVPYRVFETRVTPAFIESLYD